MSVTELEHGLSNFRKPRGVVHSSITHLGNRLKDLEATPDGPGIGDCARQLVTKLESLDKDFRALHFKIVDLIDAPDTEQLNIEQDTLDGHDDDITSISLCLQHLIVNPLNVNGKNSSTCVATSHRICTVYICTV